MRRHAAVGFLALAAALAASADGPRRGAVRSAVRTVPVDELVEAYRTNDAYTDEHFTGKSLEVCGEIDQVTHATYGDKEGYKSVLYSSHASGSGLLVVCFFEDRTSLVPL